MNKSKFRRKHLTVKDLLTQDDVESVLDKTAGDKAEITDLISIYQDRDGYINYHITSDTTLDRKILLLEQVKIWLLQGDDND